MKSSSQHRAKIELPAKLVDVFAPPRGTVRYRAAYGGRGSGKSYSFALMAAIWGYAHPLRILCTREFQASIRESFHAELRSAIEAHPWLAAHYDVGVEYIRGKNGTEFFFRGLRNSMNAIKSLAHIDLTIVEEAEDIPEQSWQALLPTVMRQPGSEVWVVWNPRGENSPVDKRLRKAPPEGAIVAEVNWNDNPFFPAALDELRQDEQSRLDPATYAHIWEGAYLSNSNSQVFAGRYQIEPFEPSADWDGPYQGGDFGFAQDPTAAVRAWVHDQCLWIEYEAHKTGLELDHTAAFLCEAIPDFERYVTRWDSARPESISYLRRHGLPRTEPVKKWPGSVEDGIGFMRSFRRIVIHPRCRETAREFRLYSYKTDRQTGDILPTIIDAHNHCIAEGELVTCKRGSIPIEDVTTDDLVLTRGGYRRVLFSGLMDINRDIVTVHTTNGAVKCTPDHKIWTDKGFVRADALRYGDSVLTLENQSWSRQLNGTARSIADIPTAKTMLIGGIFNGWGRIGHQDCIATYGSMSTAQYPKDITSTISTETLQTTTFQILNVFRQPNTPKNTPGQTKEGNATKNTLTESGTKQKLGTLRQRASQSIAKSERCLTKILCQLQSLASIATKPSRPMQLATGIYSAQTSANPHGGVQAESMTFRRSASTAGTNSLAANTQEQSLVRAHVLAVTEAGKAERVYDLTVEGHHEFVAGNVLVSNCLDAVRYAIGPMIRRKGQPRVRVL